MMSIHELVFSLQPRGWRRAAVVLAALLAGGCHGDDPPATSATTAPLCTAADPGPARIRRLTRFELGNALADALGVDGALANRMPPDEISLGYDNNAAAYSVSGSHAMKTLEMAEAAAAAFLGDAAAVHAVANCDPMAAGDAPDCLTAFVGNLGGRLWRRPLKDDELASLLALDTTAGEGEPAVGLAAVVAAMLQAPDFVYRPEAPAAGMPVGSLSSQALATRLAFLITSSGPDQALLAAAAGTASATEGTPAWLPTETQRLLASPRALESFQHFVSQWWELDPLPSVQKDTNLYRAWTASVPAAMSQETTLFLAAAWQEGPTLDRLFRGTSTFVNPTLAGFYGYPVPARSEFQAVALDPTRASGLFTQGSFLVTHAKADQTSPIQRGRFVRSQLFCAPPPPPPADIVITPPSVDPRLSTRERFAQHTADGFCAGCHRLMDPIGFAFEHFDAVGRWRDVDGGKPVDAAGSLTATDVDGALTGVNDLATRIAKSAQVRTCVATQWFRWAFGRDQETPDDVCTIGALSNALAKAKGDPRALAPATVTTPTFLMNRNAPAGDAP